MYPMIYNGLRRDVKEVVKTYAPGFSITCGQYKDYDLKTQNLYQFTLGTAYGIDTNKDFNSPEEAFEYADKMILGNFLAVIKSITGVLVK